MKRAVRIAAGVAGLAFLFVANEASSQGRPAVVQVDAVTEQPLTQTRPVLGRIVSRQEGSVATRVAGRVLQVEVDVGDRVEEGDLLAVLDPAQLQLDRDLAEAEYQTALSQVEIAQRQIELLTQERDRLEQLRSSAAFSRAGYDDKIKEIEVANSEVVASRSRVAESRIRLEQAQIDLEDSNIEAPYEGVITLRHISSGAYTTIGDPIVDMVNYREIEIEADVPADVVDALQPGAEVMATLDHGGAYSAKVRAVVPVENPMTRTRAVRFFGIGDDVPARAVGQSVTLELPIGSGDEVVTVSKDAVTISSGQRLVFVAEDGKAMRREVDIGRAVGARFEVRSGLEPGELVVVRGNERLRSGQPVSFEPSAVAPKANGIAEDTPSIRPASANNPQTGS